MLHNLHVIRADLQCDKLSGDEREKSKAPAPQTQALSISAMIIFGKGHVFECV